jgi:16S rRNA (cytosine1402-N4)-methyltransferase
MKKAEELHVPVLLQEVLDAFKEKPLSVFIDGTLGLGGHSNAILTNHKTSMKLLLGIDQDTNAIALAGTRLDPHRASCNVTLAHGNFGDILRLALDNGVQLGTVDGILLDIGTSSMQLDEASRGFSFMRDGPLDMRMNLAAPLTAADIVNDWSEEDIAKV